MVLNFINNQITTWFRHIPIPLLSGDNGYASQGQPYIRMVPLDISKTEDEPSELPINVPLHGKIPTPQPAPERVVTGTPVIKEFNRKAAYKVDSRELVQYDVTGWKYISDHRENQRVTQLLNITSIPQRTTPTTHLSVLRNPLHHASHINSMLSPGLCNTSETYIRHLENQFDSFVRLIDADPKSTFMATRSLEDLGYLLRWGHHLSTYAPTWVLRAITWEQMRNEMKPPNVQILQSPTVAPTDCAVPPAPLIRNDKVPQYVEDHPSRIKRYTRAYNRWAATRPRFCGAGRIRRTAMQASRKSSKEAARVEREGKERSERFEAEDSEDEKEEDEKEDDDATTRRQIFQNLRITLEYQQEKFFWMVRRNKAGEEEARKILRAANASEEEQGDDEEDEMDESDEYEDLDAEDHSNSESMKDAEIEALLKGTSELNIVFGYESENITNDSQSSTAISSTSLSEQSQLNEAFDLTEGETTSYITNSSLMTDNGENTDISSSSPSPSSSRPRHTGTSITTPEEIEAFFNDTTYDSDSDSDDDDGDITPKCLQGSSTSKFLRRSPSSSTIKPAKSLYRSRKSKYPSHYLPTGYIERRRLAGTLDKCTWLPIPLTTSLSAAYEEARWSEVPSIVLTTPGGMHCTLQEEFEELGEEFQWSLKEREDAQWRMQEKLQRYIEREYERREREQDEEDARRRERIMSWGQAG